jgi:prophage antirepressor-like protein
MKGLYDANNGKGSSETLYPLEVTEVKNAPSDASEIGKQAIDYRNRVFNGDLIRVIKLKDGGIGFVADDVCKILGYKNTNDTIGKHCKMEITKHPFQTDGGKQQLSIIQEPDLYRLVIKSQKPEAMGFERWVMEEVLPDIRQTGKYKVSRKINYIPETTPELSAESEQAVQVELFPRIFNGTFPDAFTKKLNNAKHVLAQAGKTFPTNKDYLMYLAGEGLKAIDELEGRV